MALAFAGLLACAAHAQARSDEAAAGEVELQAPESLVAAARAIAARHTGRTLASELEVRPPDPRLRLPACSGPLTGGVAPGTRSPARLTVEVRCAAPAWRQYLAVSVRAAEAVVVAARPIPRLAAIAADDLEVVERDLATLGSGWFRRPEDAIGRIAQRAIGAGEVLAPGAAKAPAIVRRGQEVTLVADSGAFSVRSRGIAVTDGGLAERVRIRNAATGRQVEGVVRSADVVAVAVQ